MDPKLMKVGEPMLLGILFTTILFIARSAVAITGGLLASSKTQFGRARRIYRIDISESQLWGEFSTIIKIIPFYSVMVAIGYALNLIRYSDFSWSGTFLTFAILFLWNETWFYFFHRLEHTPKFIKLHATHHRSKVTTPLTVSSFSFGEQTAHLLFAVSIPALLSHFVPITFAGVVVYSVPMIIFNILGHMNVEVYPAWFTSTLIGQFFVTPTYHALHHSRIKGHYGLLTTIPDRLFGSYFNDYYLVQSRAAAGHGLTSLGERLGDTQVSAL